MITWLIVAALAVVVFVTLASLKGVFDLLRAISAVKRRPDDAYDFFSSHPEEWTLFNVAHTAVPADHVPSGKSVGPFEFRVPKLDNRTVTVYGKSKDCFQSLDQFLFSMKVKRRGQPNAGEYLHEDAQNSQH